VKRGASAEKPVRGARGREKLRVAPVIPIWKKKRRYSEKGKCKEKKRGAQDAKGEKTGGLWWKRVFVLSLINHLEGLGGKEKRKKRQGGGRDPWGEGGG